MGYGNLMTEKQQPMSTKNALVHKIPKKTVNFTPNVDVYSTIKFHDGHSCSGLLPDRERPQWLHPCVDAVEAAGPQRADALILVRHRVDEAPL